LIEFVQFFYRPTRLDCYDCISLKQELGGKIDCIKCGRIELMAENFLVVGLIEKYSAILLDGNGSIQPQGIEMVLQLEGIEAKHEIIDKMIIYINHAKMTQRSKT